MLCFKIKSTYTLLPCCIPAACSRQTNKTLSPAGYPRRAYFSYPTYYAIGERVQGSLEEPSTKFGSRSSKR